MAAIFTITMIISITMKMRTLMSSLSVPSAFHRGGVGAGAIRTDIMVMVTRTDTVMAMDMATTAMAMATAAGPEWRCYTATPPALGITNARLTAALRPRHIPC